jgi:hypothetical protein
MTLGDLVTQMAYQKTLDHLVRFYCNTRMEAEYLTRVAQRNGHAEIDDFRVLHYRDGKYSVVES